MFHILMGLEDKMRGGRKLLAKGALVDDGNPQGGGQSLREGLEVLSRLNLGNFICEQEKEGSWGLQQDPRCLS